MNTIDATHLAWCTSQCTGDHTGIHTSDPVPGPGDGCELIGVRVTTEQLAETSPITSVCLELTDDYQIAQYRFPLAQARSVAQKLQHAVQLAGEPSP